MNENQFTFRTTSPTGQCQLRVTPWMVSSPESAGLHFLKRFYLFIFRQRKGEREGEKHQCVVASHAPPTGDLACNPGMCPDWESNWQSFSSQASTQSTEPRQPGLQACIFITSSLLTFRIPGTHSSSMQGNLSLRTLNKNNNNHFSI